MKFDFLGETMADKSKEIAKDIDHELIGVWKVANEDNTLHSGQRFKKVEVLIIIRRVRTLQAGGKLAEEELKDIAEFVMCVRSIRSKQSEDVSQTASSVSLDSTILVKKNGIVDQLLADCRECSGINAVLVEVCELGVEILQLLEQGICGMTLSNEPIVKLEFLG